MNSEFKLITMIINYLLKYCAQARLVRFPFNVFHIRASVCCLPYSQTHFGAVVFSESRGQCLFVSSGTRALWSYDHAEGAVEICWGNLCAFNYASEFAFHCLELGGIDLNMSSASTWPSRERSRLLSRILSAYGIVWSLTHPALKTGVALRGCRFSYFFFFFFFFLLLLLL